jgi:vancomycin resistance protein YoaR
MNGTSHKPDVTNTHAITKDDVATPATPHSRWAELFFKVRVMAHQIRRSIADSLEGHPRCDKMHDGPYSMVVGESRSRLWSDDRLEEAAYQRGKVHNLRIAVQELDCAVLLPGQVFSFWNQIGRATEERGYVVGRMLQQGCMVPAVGGGLCQLSNALYDAALQSGCEIVERHAHSRAVPGSAAAAGRDATVAWNYVDLRFRSRVPLMIRASVTGSQLVVSFRAFPGTVLPKENAAAATGNAGSPDATRMREPAATCATCGQTTCFRNESRGVS